MTAVLLYAALKSGLVGGRMFPDLSEVTNIDSVDWSKSGASIFWGLFSGISIKIYAALASLVDNSFGGSQ